MEKNYLALALKLKPNALAFALLSKDFALSLSSNNRPS